MNTGQTDKMAAADGQTSDIAQRVIETIAAQLALPTERVTPNASFQDDLKADSLAVAQLILGLEETFDVMVPDEQAEKLRTVADAIAFVEDRAR